MRTPFSMPSGCPTISVDINILGSMPFCSMPKLTMPSVAMHPLEISPPDIAPPPVFACLSVAVTGTLGSRLAVSGQLVNRASSQGVEDCAAPMYALSLDIPCMPTVLTNVVLATHTASAFRFNAGVVRAGTATSCGMKLSMDVNVPCTPTLGTGIHESGTQRDGHWLVSMDLKASSCTVNLAGGLNIVFPSSDVSVPCLPFSLLTSKTVVNFGLDLMTADPIPRYSVNFHLSKLMPTSHRTCCVKGTISMYVPCGPVIDNATIQVTQNGVPISNSPKLVMSITPNAAGWPSVYCIMDTNISIDIPCPKAGLVSYATSNRNNGGHYVYRNKLVANPKTCDLSISPSLIISFPANGCSLYLSTHISKAVAGTMLLQGRWVNKSAEPCRNTLELSVAVPCAPIIPAGGPPGPFGGVPNHVYLRTGTPGLIGYINLVAGGPAYGSDTSCYVGLTGSVALNGPFTDSAALHSLYFRVSQNGVIGVNQYWKVTGAKTVGTTVTIELQPSDLGVP